ncbi:MAG: SusC/RagA family TonB-linked outer membrane protein, partial [Pedobacter sp.]
MVYPATGTGATLAAANATARAGIKALLFNNPFNVADAEILNADGTMNPNAKLKYDDFNWIEDLRRVGKRSDYTMAVSGANEKSDYYTSLGYLKEQSYLVRSDYNRFNGRVSVNNRPTSWLKTGLNLTGNVTKSDQADTGSGSIVNPFNFTRSIGPIYPVYVHDPVTGQFLYDSKGQKIYDTGNLAGIYGIANRPSSALPGRHAVQETLLNSNNFRRNVVGARTYGEISFLKDFKFTTNVGFDGTSTFTDDFQNKIVGDGAPTGRARNTASQTFSYTVEQLLNYNKKVGEHTFGGLLGHNNYSFRFKNLTAARNTQILDGITELVNFATTTDADSQTDTYRKEAFFGRLNYDYKSRYFLSASIRRDASSKWAEGHQWGTFYSVSGAWLLSEESFMKNVSWVNYLKLRSSFGSLGNDGISGYYPAQGLYALGFN